MGQLGSRFPMYNVRIAVTTFSLIERVNLVIINVLGIVNLLSLPDTLALRVRHVVDNPLQSTQTNEAAQPAQPASESVVMWLDNGSVG